MSEEKKLEIPNGLFFDLAKFSGISFKTESGHIIIVSPEDCQKIANEIIKQGLLDRGGDRVTLVINKDENLEKIRVAYDILTKEQSKMSDKTLAAYHIEILKLIKVNLHQEKLL